MCNVTYKCAACGREVAVSKTQPAPRCCGKDMEAEPLPFCTTAPNPEMARNYEADEPCDDGTVPKKAK